MKDFRERWLLNTGDMIKAGEHSYVIIGEPLGFGGSAVIYPAKRSESELLYAIKECFPNRPECFMRKDGIVTVISEDDREGKALLELYREMFQKECATGQSIRNFTGRSIGMWDTLTVQTITTGNQTYDASQGIYALLERMDGKGCSLSDILKECREEVSSLYPLRRGGLPDIYTTACIMEQILRALQGVQEAGYLFGDIQKNNIFFMDSRLGEGEIGFGCLLDFGCARALLEDGYTEEITDCKIFSTKGYIPPEVLHHNNGHLRLGKQADVYSIGKLMLLCLLTEEQDLAEASISLRRLLQQHHGKKINCGGTKLDFVNRILEKALQKEPSKRYKDAENMLVDILELKKLTEPPKFRLSNNMSSPDYFVPGSREKELKALKESMQKGEHPMIWGYGGIGKTETAIQLAKRMDNGKGAYLVHFRNTMRETILSLNFSGYRFEPEKKGLSLEEREELEYQEKLNLLKDYYEDSIIIIDNFDNEEKTLDELRREKAFTDLIGLNLHLIFTTRYPVGRKEWEITELNNEELLKLMKYYLKSVSVSDEELQELIEVAGRHTLTVVLMAKTMEESWGMVTPDMILEAFRKASISENSFPEVVSDQNRTYQQEQIYQHLRILFNLSGMNEEEKKVLSYSVLLPQGGMDAMLFLNCLEKEEQKCLYQLVAKGWLRKQTGNLLTMHPMICQVCREELQPNDEICRKFLENLLKKYDKKEYNFLRYAQMAECFSKAMEYLEDKNGDFSYYAGILYLSIGEYQRGLECCQRGLKIANLSPNHSNIGGIYHNIGVAYRKLGENKKSLEYCQKALSILEKSSARLDYLHIAVVYNNIGSAYAELGDYKKQLEYYEKALKLGKEQLPSNHLDIAATYHNIGYAYGNLGEYEKELEYYEKVLHMFEGQLPSNHPNIAIIYHSIGDAYGELGDYKKALEYYEKALRIKEEQLPSNHPEIAITYNNIGCAYGELGDYKKALEYYEKALKIEEKKLSSNHPNIAITYNNIGYAYGELGDYKKALEYYEKALKIKEEKLSSTHPEIANQYLNIGSTYGELGDYKKALKYYEKALKIEEEKLPSNHPKIAITYHKIGYIYGELGDYKKALEYYEKALKIKEEKNFSDIDITYYNIGYAYGELGEYEKQVEYYQKSLKVLEESLPSTHPDLVELYYDIALVYADIKDLEQSYIWCEKSAIYGYVQGMVRVSNYLIDGKGCQQNYEKALEWLNKAHTLGNYTATNNLGWMYLHGYGCKKDIWKAEELFKIAANSETPSKASCKHLGELYSGLEDTGDIIVYDVEQALYYYQKAKDLGYEGLEDTINQLLLLK